MSGWKKAIALGAILLNFGACAKLNKDKDPLREASDLKTAPEATLSSVKVEGEVLLACETLVKQGIYLANLKGDWKDGLILNSRNAESYESPKWLSGGATKSWKLFFTIHSAGADRLTLGTADGQRFTQTPLTNLPANRAEIQGLYQSIGLPNPGYQAFTAKNLLLSSENGFSLRTQQNPTVEVAHWDLNTKILVNPRMSKSEVYFDTVEDETIRQMIVRYDSEFSVRAKEALPEPLLEGTQVQQMGLRLFDEDLYVWQEWSNGKGLLRFMERHSRSTRELEIPSKEMISPHYEIYKDNRDGYVFSFSTRTGVLFYSLSFGSLNFLQKIDFPEKNKKWIADRGPKFWPASFVTDQSAQNLFLTLPEGEEGSHLYLVNQDDQIQRVSSLPCKNPSFF